jgi:hypothetical protein
LIREIRVIRVLLFIREIRVIRVLLFIREIRVIRVSLTDPRDPCNPRLFD